MGNRDPRVGIVMITHNRSEEVLRTLDRLTGLPEEPPIVVVDNGSSDGTADAVAGRYAAAIVLRLEENLGAAGRNLGVERLETPFVAFADDDTWWEPGSLRRAADFLESHPRLAVLTGRILEGPEEREAAICRELARSPLPSPPGLPGHPLLGFLAGASVVRRSAFLAVGGFDRRLFIGGEEELVAAELACRGWCLRYVPELVVHHDASPRRDVHLRNWHVVAQRPVVRLAATSLVRRAPPDVLDRPAVPARSRHAQGFRDCAGRPALDPPRAAASSPPTWSGSSACSRRPRY